MPSITITWQIKDMHACPICKALNGHSWTFTTPEPLPAQLVAGGQLVWAIGIGSRAHGHREFNCRCKLKMSEPDLSDVNEWVEKKIKELEALKVE